MTMIKHYINTLWTLCEDLIYWSYFVIMARIWYTLRLLINGDVILTSVILWIATLYGSVHEGAADSACEISDGTEKWYDNGLF